MNYNVPDPSLDRKATIDFWELVAIYQRFYMKERGKLFLYTKATPQCFIDASGFCLIVVSTSGILEVLMGSDGVSN